MWFTSDLANPLAPLPIVPPFVIIGGESTLDCVWHGIVRTIVATPRHGHEANMAKTEIICFIVSMDHRVSLFGPNCAGARR